MSNFAQKTVVISFMTAKKYILVYFRRKSTDLGPKKYNSQIEVSRSTPVRNLPLPLPGGDDITCVRNALHEVRAPGVDVYRDVVKVVRKLSGTNPTNSLGTVLVELRNEESRASLMKNKKNLANHTSPTLQNLIIKNAKSMDRMFIENCTNSLLRLSHGDSYFIAGNGQIKQKNPNNSFQPLRHHHHNPNYAQPRQLYQPNPQPRQQYLNTKQWQPHPANTQSQPRQQHGMINSQAQTGQHPTTATDVQPRQYFQQSLPVGQQQVHLPVGHQQQVPLPIGQQQQVPLPLGQQQQVPLSVGQQQQVRPFHPQQPAPHATHHIPVVPLPQPHCGATQNITTMSQTQPYIPTLVQTQYDPFAMIPRSIQSVPVLPPLQPPVSIAGFTPHQAVRDQEGGEVQADRDQVLQDFEFENDSTGHSENLSSQ